MVSEEFKAIENKLKTDKEFRDQTQFALAFVSARVGEFQANAEIAAEAASKVKGMEKESAQMAALAVTAANASKNAGDALEALTSIGLNSDSDFESFSNNTYTSFMLLNTTIEAAESYVAAVDAYIANPDNTNNSELLFARDLWVSYNISDAMYNSDKDAFAYWTGKGIKSSDEDAGRMLAALTPNQQMNLVSGMICNTALSSVLEGAQAIQGGNNAIKFRLSESLNSNFSAAMFSNFEGAQNLSFSQNAALNSMFSTDFISALSKADNLGSAFDATSLIRFMNKVTLDAFSSVSQNQLSSSMMSSVLSNIPATTLNMW